MTTEKKQKVLVYTQYYYPEVASLAQLCTDLCEFLSSEYDVSVICSVPCYMGNVDDKYLSKRYYKEEYNGVKIIRVRVPQFDKHKKSSRIKNISAYFFRSIFATFMVPKSDYIITESQPPILGGILGVFGKIINFFKFKKSKFVYVIQDFNPEQTMAVGYSNNGFILKLMMFFDKLSCRISDKAVVVGSDMLETMKKRFTNKKGVISKHMPKTTVINNWMDNKCVYPLAADNSGVVEFQKKYRLYGKRVIMYSGNIGLFYDIENIFKVIERFKNRTDVIFPFVGEGTFKEKLENYAIEHRMENVIFIPYQDKDSLVYSLNSADVHFIVNALGIKGISCPSKLYGILSVAKPALAVLEEGTEARTVIEQTGCGLAVSPADYDGIANLIETFLNYDADELNIMGKRGYEYMQNNLNSTISLNKYKQLLESL